MALNKKKSRKIVVDGIEYRWIARESSGYRELTVQTADGNGQKMCVIFDSRWDRAKVAGGFDASVNRPVLSATPSFVAAAIQVARENGWHPDKSGPTFMFDHKEGGFMIRPNQNLRLSSILH